MESGERLSTEAQPGEEAVSALIAVSRLLAATTEGAADDIHATIVGEACECFGAAGAVLLTQMPGRRLRVLGGVHRLHQRDLALDDYAPLSEMLDRRLRLVRADSSRMRAVEPLVEEGQTGEGLLLLLRSADRLDGVLLLHGLDDSASVDAEVATAFADAAAAALDRLRTIEEHVMQVRQQHALTRAAKSLNESLDLDTVLARICQEAVTVMDADMAGVYQGAEGGGQTMMAVHGLPPETIGWTLPPGSGLAGKIAQQGRAMLSNDYQRIAKLPGDSPLPDIISAVGAPMEWDAALRGVLTVGYLHSRTITQTDLALLETFAELAAAACANATAHAGLAHVARTDGLTGCLNHAALHDGLAKEIERALRGEHPPLSLILIDLDDFKQINEVHGHLIGDEVLRRAGHALRHAMRPYDLAARYGGDEFALVCVDADEDAATDVAMRALERLGTAMDELLPEGGTPGTAGVAQWSAGVSSTELVARADRALLFAKQEGRRGGVHTFTTVPDHFRPGRFARQDRGLPEPPPMPVPSREFPEARVDERLRKRTRGLAIANELGARLSSMVSAGEIQEAAVEELHRAFGYSQATLLRLRDDGDVEEVAQHSLVRVAYVQPPLVGLIGRCLRTRRPVLSNDVLAEPDYVSTAELADVRSELIVPLWVGDALWGVIDVESVELDAFDQDDVTLLETISTQVGSAMRGAFLYEQLERAYLGTAEALAAALEAKDQYTAEHAQSIVAQAEAVARELGYTEDALRDLRFAAVFHDIGKIAVPEAILHKPGPLNAEEREVMERHTIVGEQILAPVEFLSTVRTLVRHEHERWDGAGYPDGLAGEDIPLGSRIILVCDALHAMTSDRPYRKAMNFTRAMKELRKHAGTQFDPAVVEALERVAEAEG